MKKLIKSTLEQCASRLGPHRHSRTEPRLWLLMYHRILPVSDPRYGREEPGMIVTPDTFRQQLRILKTLFEVMPMTEWCERRDAGRALPMRACAITFDDGWLDNYEYAFPILREEQLPATLFAVAGMIGTQRQFWPNRLARVLGALQGNDLPWLEQLGYLPRNPLEREAIARLIDKCKLLPDDELHALLDSAEKSLGLASEQQPALVNWDQLREMQSSEVFEIGSHTSNHYRLLPQLSTSVLREEIIASKDKLEAELHRPIKNFCYPNGDTSATAEAIVREHYRAAVTTQPGINGISTPTHTLSRIAVHEDASNTPTRFEARLSGWL